MKSTTIIDVAKKAQVSVATVHSKHSSKRIKYTTFFNNWNYCA